MTLEYISVMLRLRIIQQESHITMLSTTLNETRTSIFPENQDTWESIDTVIIGGEIAYRDGEYTESAIGSIIPGA